VRAADENRSDREILEEAYSRAVTVARFPD
jgi:hypothetical protein